VVVFHLNLIARNPSVLLRQAEAISYGDTDQDDPDRVGAHPIRGQHCRNPLSAVPVPGRKNFPFRQQSHQPPPRRDDDNEAGNELVFSSRFQDPASFYRSGLGI
jgi:hypothetical protein